MKAAAVRFAMGALGGAWIGTDEGVRNRPSSPMQAMLFAALLLNRGRTVPLRTLVEIMWPNAGARDETAARNSLRVHMSNLRRWVRDIAGVDAADLFTTSGDGYLLDLPIEDFDVAAFERHVAAGQGAILTTDFQAAQLELDLALKMWADPYPELAHYQAARSEKIRLDELRELAVDELLEVNLRSGRAAEMISELEARLVKHVFREQTYGQLMRALYAVGRQADALATYQRARTSLRDELGLEPSASLRDLEAQILAQTLGTEVQPRQPFVVRPSRLAGRSEELARGVQALQSGQLLIVSGEPGIGKTRLVHELALEVVGRNWVWTQSVPDRAAPPLWSLAQALGFNAEPLTDAASEFARNQRVLDELKARSGPTVLVFDDFHWADEATIRFVRQLAQQPAGPLATVLSARNIEADLGEHAKIAIAELGRSTSSVRIDLAPLDIEAVRRLAADFDIPSEKSGQLLEKSAGNPLFLHEILAAGTEFDDVPPLLTAAILGRLAAVPQDLQQVLAVAAVVGDVVDPTVLVRATSTSAARVVEALDYGRRAGFLAASNSDHDRFAHRLFRDSLSTLIADVDQCRIHDRVATELEGRIASSDQEIFKIAYHAHRALPVGSPMRAMQASRDAGDVAAAVLAVADARDHYQRSKDAAELLDVDARSVCLPELLCELGYCTIRAGDTPTGRSLLLRAIEAAELRDDAAVFARAARCLTESSSPPGTNDRTIDDIVERAIVLTDGHKTEDRVQLLVDLAGLRYFTHSLEHRRTLVDEAIALAAEIDDRSVAIAHAGAWLSIYEPGMNDQRSGLVRRSRLAADRSNSLDFSMLSRMLGVTDAVERGDIAAARDLIASGAELVASLQAPRQHWFLSGWQVLLKTIDGQLDDAEALSLAGWTGWENGSHPDGLVAFATQQTMIRLLQGRGDEIVDLMRDLVADEPERLASRAVLALALAPRGDAESVQVLHAVLSDLVEHGVRSDALTTTTLAFTAEACFVSSDVPKEAARALADLIVPFRDLHTVLNSFGTGGAYWGSLHHAYGLALASAGHRDDARVALDLAEREHARVGAVLFAERSRNAIDAIAREGG